MIDIFRTEGGFLTARVAQAWLHSSRDPAREAERFLDGQLKEGARNFIVIGGCLGYLELSLRRRRPEAKFLSLQLDGGFRGKELAGPDGRRLDAWYPDSGQGPDAYILARFDPRDLEGLQVLSWAPAEAAFPQVCEMAREGLRKAVLTLNGSVNALAAFGRPLLMRPLKNLALGRRFFSMGPGLAARPILIAASGPSLEDSLALIKENRQGFVLCALSSALLALAEKGIEPDCIVSSDPGYWALLHLQGEKHKGIPLIFPLQAALPRPLLESSPLIPITEGGSYQSALLECLGLGALRLSARGTVAATALDVCLRLSRGPIIFAGLDMGSQDLRSHCRPQAFDAFHEKATSRLRPAYSQTFERIIPSYGRGRAGFRQSPQLESYAAHFGRMGSSEKRLYRMESPAPALEGLRQLSRGEFEALCASPRGPRFESILREEKAAATQGPQRAELLIARAKSLLGSALAQLDAGIYAEKDFGIEGRIDSGDGVFEVLECLSMSHLLKYGKALRRSDAGLRREALRGMEEAARELFARMDRLGAARGGQDGA